MVGVLTVFVAQPAQAQVPLVDVVVGTVGGLFAPATAQADPVQQLLAGINSVRSGVGVGPVTLDPVVSLVAQAWALVMATAGEISHNPNVGSQLNGIVAVAENVGRGRASTGSTTA